MLNAIAGILGVALVIVMASDVFQSVIVPRPTYAWRPSAQIVPNGWRLMSAVGRRIPQGDTREALYGVFAPGMLVVLMAFWVVGLTIGFGLIFFAVRADLKPVPPGFWSATYYAGTSLLTLGYGDFVAQTGAARAVSLAAAAIGLATFAIVTAFLFLLSSAFQRREQFIVAMRERTGAPPSGADLLERHVDLAMLDELTETFRRAEDWLSDVMESHLAYPILSYFRSTHDNQSWVGTVGALLDASTLLITTLDAGATGPSNMVNRLGRHLVRDFAFYYHFDEQGTEVGIERDEFEQTYERLRAKGLAMRDIESAWTAFAALRATYAQPLNEMAHWWCIPPALWIGGRSATSRHEPLPPASV